MVEYHVVAKIKVVTDDTKEGLENLAHIKRVLRTHYKISNVTYSVFTKCEKCGSMVDTNEKICRNCNERIS